MSLQQTLNNMVGLPYLVNTHEHIIIRVKVDGDTVHIITDKDWFKFDIEEAPDKIKGFLPMDKEVETSDIMTLPKLSDNKDLTSIVMEQNPNGPQRPGTHPGGQGRKRLHPNTVEYDQAPATN